MQVTQLGQNRQIKTFSVIAELVMVADDLAKG